MPLKHINAAEAKKLVDEGALLVDVREANEYAGENIPGARNEPLSRPRRARPISGAPAVVFHCKSGARTRMNAVRAGRVHRRRGLYPRRRHRGLEGGGVSGEAGVGSRQPTPVSHLRRV